MSYRFPMYQFEIQSRNVPKRYFIVNKRCMICKNPIGHHKYKKDAKFVLLAHQSCIKEKRKQK